MLLLKHNRYLILALLIGGLAHGIYMFRFPYFENDEGTYLSQAWSLIRKGTLSPYTYWYDHAPAGWFLIALWVRLTGGFFTFGPSMFSGRVLMLVIHIVSSYFLYQITKRLTGRDYPAFLAVLLFSLSPLAIYFQRRLLLDNLMIFWVLFALFVLLRRKLTLGSITLAAIMFGVAILTKENAIFFAPGIFYFLYKEAPKKFTSFIFFGLLSGSVVSLYLLYAFLKGELLPVGFGGSHVPRVSLITTLNQQLARGISRPPWDPQSDFYFNLREWWEKDPGFMAVGVIVSGITLVLAIFITSFRFPAILLWLYWIFLLRGKLVINFYIIPLIPLLSLSTSLIINNVLVFFHKYSREMLLARVFLMVLIVMYFGFYSTAHWRVDETKPQLEAMNWYVTHASRDTTIATEAYTLIDFWEKGFHQADWFWKIWEDPETMKKYSNDWKQIQSIFLSHEMLKQMKLRDGKPDLIREALFHSQLIAHYGPSNKNTFVSVDTLLTTNGDWAAIYQLPSPHLLTLNTAWNFFKKHYLISYGQVVEPESNNRTTSEGQSYALLQAVFMNDKATFAGVWAWTRDHMQHRLTDTLFSWLWEKQGDVYVQKDAAAATDADTDIALALLLASQRFKDEGYKQAAMEIMADIWKKEVVLINGRYIVIAGPDMKRGDGYLVNPSYFSPATYRLFATVDSARPWQKLADDSYFFLNRLTKMSGNTSGLVPNWVFVNSVSGALGSPAPYYSDTQAAAYGFDAFRTYWRVGLDWVWNQTPQAKAFLDQAASFFTAQQAEGTKAIYSLQGLALVPYESLSTLTAPLIILKVTNPTYATKYYDEHFKTVFNDELGNWNQQPRYYDQAWAWLATALYAEKLPYEWPE